MSLDIKQCPHCGDYFGAKLIEKHIKNCDKKAEKENIAKKKEQKEKITAK